MHDMKQKLISVGTNILTASRNELYVSMRFLDIALSSLPYEMDLTMRTIGTDGQTLRYNPAYLANEYRESSKLVNRAYLHMLLHCIFRHMYNGDDKDKELWDLSCDIAVSAVIDSMKYKCIEFTVPDQRAAMYDRLKKSLKVLTAEGIYKVLEKDPPDFLEMQELNKYFRIDDHVFWEAKHEDKGDDSRKNNQDKQQNQQNQQEQQQEQKPPQSQDQNDRQKEEQKWKQVEEKIRTNFETYSKDATDLAGSMYEYIRVDTRQRYDYREFLKKFTMRREELKLDPETFDYIYYTYGLNHYGNMPLIEPLEYKESRKIEELAIVLDTSESCSGEIIRRFLSETFSILEGSDTFFRRMNVHIIQSDAKAQSDTVIHSPEEVKKYIDSFKVIGHGGTDFRPAIDYVSRLCKEGVFRKLKGLIYFTDGYGVYPSRCPDFKVAFAFLDDNYNDRHVPPWAIKLILGSDDLKIQENGK